MKDEKIMYKTWDAVQEKHELETIWCDTHLNPSDVAYDRDMILFYDGGWGKDGFEEISVPVTYEKLYIAADKLIRHSGDMHHIFIEEIKYMADNDLVLHTGS